MQTLLSESDALDHLLVPAKVLTANQSRAKDRFDVQTKTMNGLASEDG